MANLGPGAVIRLNREWRVGQSLGEGGFGRVYEVACDGETGFVAKIIPAVPGAERELLLADQPASRFVVPIVDRGEWDDHLVLVMPRAEKSLADEMSRLGGRLPVDSALAVLTEVASGLADIDGKIVHRDLKPSNVLFLHGRWQIADFGIARYADATTEPDTRKYAKTMPYAAPEQWRGERATAATDVYGFGAMAFEVLSGALPFPGPSEADFRHQHLHVTPPALAGVPTALRSLVDECLLKAPGARPTAANIVVRLRGQRENRPRFKALELAHQEAVRGRTEEERRRSVEQSDRERVAALREAGSLSLANVVRLLARTVAESAPIAQIDMDPGDLGLSAIVTNARLVLGGFRVVAPVSEMQFEVILEARVRLEVQPKEDGWQGREHSLWFCDAQTQGVYRWFELAFDNNPTYGRHASRAPFGLPPSDDAAAALRRGLSRYRVVWPFSPFDQGDEGSLVERWLTWFGEASIGKLGMPLRVPELPVEGSWRRG